MSLCRWALLGLSLSGCGVNRVDLGKLDASTDRHDANEVDAGPGDVEGTDAESFDVWVTPTLQCGALGEFAGVHEAVRVSRERAPSVILGARTVVGHASNTRGGQTMQLVSGQLWWSESLDGCRDNWWGIRTWRFPLDPDLQGMDNGVCEPASVRGGLLSSIAYNGNAVGLCYSTHARILGRNDAGVDVWGGVEVFCGKLNASPGSLAQTVGSLPYEEEILIGSRGGETSRPSFIAVLSSPDRGRAALRFDEEMRPQGEPVPFGGPEYRVRSAVVIGDEAWVASSLMDDIVTPGPEHPNGEIIRLRMSDARPLGALDATRSLFGESIPRQIDMVLNGYGVMMLIGRRPETEGSENAVELAAACPDGSFGRALLATGYDHWVNGLSRFNSGWVALTSSTDRASGLVRLWLYVLDASGALRGSPALIDDAAGNYAVLARGAERDDLWVLSQSGSKVSGIDYVLRHVWVR